MTAAAYGLAFPATRGLLRRCPPNWVPRVNGKAAPLYLDFANGRYWLNGREWHASEDASAVVAASAGSIDGSSARYRQNGAGMLVAATGLRFDWSLGLGVPTLLYEPSRANICTRSNNIANWTNQGLTLTAGQGDPFGGTSAYLIAGNGSGPFSNRIYPPSVALTAGAAYAFSWLLKPGTDTALGFSDAGFGTMNARYNPATQTFIGSDANVTSKQVIALGNGWQIVSYVFMPAANQANSLPSVWTSGAGNTFTLGGLMIEAASTRSSWIVTAAAAATRAADALELSLPGVVSQCIVTFGNGSTQTLAASGAYTLPSASLDRTQVRSLAFF